MPLIRKYWGVILVFVLSSFAILPFFNFGFFPIHDDTQAARVYEMEKALKDGMFPVRWVSDLGYGYGYPLYNFYAPLSYYAGGFVNLLGFDALTSAKIMMVFGILLSGISMYLLAKEFWGKAGGVISSLFYVYAPYHAVDIYVRGDVGEIYAYAFLPLIFLGFYKIALEKKVNWIFLTAAAYAGVILSHNLTAMMITPFIIVVLLYCFIVQKNLCAMRYTLYAFLIGLLLSAFYWIPALLEMKYTNVMSQIGGGADFRDHFLCVAQLWESQWGFGGSAPGCLDGLSFRIGKLHIFAVLLSVIIAFSLYIIYRFSGRKNRKRFELSIILLPAAGFIISVFLTLEASKPLWEFIYHMSFFQYPWRFLILASFFSSFLAGFFIRGIYLLLDYLKIKRINLFINFTFAAFLFFLFYSNIKLFKPQLLLPKTADDYINEKELKFFTSRISDEYMPSDFPKPLRAEDVVFDKITADKNSRIEKLSVKTQEINASVFSSQRSLLKINSAFFPSWRLFIDGKEQTFISDKGINFELEKGFHTVLFKFKETQVEEISNLLSLIGFIAVILAIIKKRFI